MKNNIICEIDFNDLPQLQQILFEVLYNDISLEEMEDLYKKCKSNDDIHILGYFVDDILVATITLNILTLVAGKKATLWSLAVKDNYRRLGIATKLILHAENIARKQGVKSIWFFSGFHRENAHMLYRKLGYDENRDKAFVKFFES